MTHTLKIEPNYLKNILDDKKKSEIRYNDRDYQIGDILEFWAEEEYQWVQYKITHIHSGLGLEKGYVCLSIERSYE